MDWQSGEDINTGRFQGRNRQQGLQFETLEERRVLANGIVDAPAETLTVSLDSNDIQVIFSHDGLFNFISRLAILRF